MPSFTLWLYLLLHLVIYLLSCFDVLICLIFFLFALIKNSFVYSKHRSVIVFLYFAACLSCLCFLPVLRSCLFCVLVLFVFILDFCGLNVQKLVLFFVSLFYTLFFFFFFGCSPYGLSLPLSPLQVGIPCCLLLYSILVNFLTNKMTNWDQMNIPSDLKSFMRESIHELGMLHTHNTCLLISSRIPLSSSRGTTDNYGKAHARACTPEQRATLDQGPFRWTYQSIITTSVTQAWTYIGHHCPLDWLPLIW